MLRHNIPTGNDSNARVSRPASFPNNNLNGVSFKDLSKSFKNLKVNERKKLKRNSLTDSEASEAGSLQQARKRGAGGGVVTNRSMTSNHHARALQEIRSSLEPYAASEASDFSRESVQGLARELNVDETTVETAVRNSSGSIQAAREKLILILKKKMKNEDLAAYSSYVMMNSAYPPYSLPVHQPGEYHDTPLHQDYQMDQIASVPHRGSPDGASLRAESPIITLGNNAHQKFTISQGNKTKKNHHYHDMERQNMEQSAHHGDYYIRQNSGFSLSSAGDNGNGRNKRIPGPHGSTQHLLQGADIMLENKGLHINERNNSEDSSVSAAIMPGHVQQMVQKMSPSSPTQSSSFFGNVKLRRNSTHMHNMPHQMSSTYVMNQNYKPVIKGLSPSSNLYQVSNVQTGPGLSTEMSFNQNHFPAHPPPSYPVTPNYHPQKELSGQPNYDPSELGYGTQEETKRHSLRLNSAKQEKEWMNSINGALSGNINLPIFQPTSSVSALSSGRHSLISSEYQPAHCDAEPCHASYTTVASAPILLPVNSKPVSKPQPMTAEIPVNYRGSVQNYTQQLPSEPPNSGGKNQHFMDDQSFYPSSSSQRYVIGRDPPPYSESSGASSTVHSILSNEGRLYKDSNMDVENISPAQNLRPSAQRPSITENYLNALNGVSSNSNTSNNTQTVQLSTTMSRSRATNILPKGTEPAVKAAIVTASNSKRHACSYSAVSAAKQQREGSIAGIDDTEQHHIVVTLASQADSVEEKTIKTSPVPVRRSVKKKQEKERPQRCEVVSSESEEELIQAQAAIQRTKRVKMFSPEAYKFYMEQHIENVIKGCHSRASRRNQLEQEMEKMNLPREDQEQMRTMLYQKESNYIRLKRGKIDLSMFQMVKPLGVGAFGKVYLACKTSSGALYAIKTLKKKDVLKRNQVAHVKAERDILSEADNDWVVRLYYTFQDKQFLYFVMDYIPGGDMMSLLIKKGIFEEHLACFYTAELTLALESVHKMGFIHRDIKPDNILIDRDGHIKLTDFGLCTGFRWTHDSKYYQKGHVKQDSMDFSHEWNKYGGCALKTLDRRRIRDANRHVARSLVGTPNYIAPEVLLREGYTQLCDWWSVGVILYEMVVGQPPFNANTPEETQLKVINWEKMLYFPDSARLNYNTKDLIVKLCSDQKSRIGKRGIEEIKQHPYFAKIDWNILRNTEAPYIPRILYAEDTSNFDAPEADLMLNQSQVGTMNNNTLLHPGEHAFFEFTFRRFFDENGRSYRNHCQYSELATEEVPEESDEEDMQTSDSFSCNYSFELSLPSNDHTEGNIRNNEYL